MKHFQLIRQALILSKASKGLKSVSPLSSQDSGLYRVVIKKLSTTALMVYISHHAKMESRS